MQRMGTRFREVPTFEVRRWSAVKKGYTPFADGDVLLARITPCFENGKGGIPRGLPNGLGAGSTEFVVLRPKQSALVPEYLLALLKTDQFLSDGKASMTGAVGQQRVPKSLIFGYKINLAPYGEQQRIADKLDVLLAKVDACRERLDRVPAILKRFREAVLEAAVSGRLTEEWRELNPALVDASADVSAIGRSHADAGGHRRGNAAPPTNDVHDLESSAFPSGWGLVDLRELVDPARPITYGILKPGPELADGVPYVRVADFPSERLNLDTIRRTSPKIDQEFRRSRLRPGDLLLSIRGSVGRLIVIPMELDGANITQDSARLAIQESVEPRYVLWFLRSNIAQSRMQRAVKGVAVRGINIGDVRALQVPLPSRYEQREIARRVDELFALADGLEGKYRVAVERVERLTPAVLAKAFRGELVPQDPNDEPAAMLLERIRAERESVASTTSISRTRAKTRGPVKRITRRAKK